MKLLTLTVLLALLAVAGIAQTADATPQYSIAAGAGFNYLESPQAKGWATFAAKIADKTYSLSTLDMTSKGSSLRTGLLRTVYSSGGFTLGILADAGVVAGQGSVGGAFTGGGVVTCDISKFAKVPGAFAVGAVRVVQAAGGGVSPTFSFGVGKNF